MLTFWIIAALFVLLILWFILPPLLEKQETEAPDQNLASNVLVYQNQHEELEADLQNGLIGAEQYQQEKDALERRLLDDVKPVESSAKVSSLPAKKFAYGVTAFIPIGAIALYLLVGNPKALNPETVRATTPAAEQGGPMSPEQIAGNVEKLAARLKQNPNDAQGWLMLARSYSMMERYSEAAAAYEHATQLNEKDADVWADYGEAQALANGRRLAGKPLDAINKALQLDPKNQKALALAGSAAYEAGDYKMAVDFWQKLLPLLPPGSDLATTVADQIKKAQDLAAGKSKR